MKFQLNLTIQILLKQGQVELENFQLLLEYADAILINKTIIEDLNAVIRVIIIFSRENNNNILPTVLNISYFSIFMTNMFIFSSLQSFFT